MTATTETTIRAMRWWDIEPVMALEAAVFGADAWSASMFWSELAGVDSRRYVVAESAGAIVGYAGLCAYDGDQAYVQTIAVDPARQGEGIGARLLRDLIEEAGRRGCRRLDLEVRADNPRAIALYERHGFTRIGLRRRYYQPSNVDAIVMRREREAR